MGLMSGKKALIFGVANERSISWGITKAFHKEGAAIGLSYAGEALKDRVTPLTKQAVEALHTWLRERQGTPAQPLFPSRRGVPLSRDAVALIVAKHATTAATSCPSLRTKTVSPHTLRHSCAMQLLNVGTDVTVIALWLGHEQIASTNMYLHADMSIKERALARTAPINTPPGRYRPPDTLLTFLEAL